MYWKRMLIIAFTASVGIFAVFALTHWNSFPHGFILDAAEAVALGLGFVGFGALRRGGHQRAYRVLRRCLGIWFTASLILYGVGTYLRINSLGSSLMWSMYLLWLLFAASFPASLYLNHKRPKSTSQPIADNAS